MANGECEWDFQSLFFIPFLCLLGLSAVVVFSHYNRGIGFFVSVMQSIFERHDKSLSLFQNRIGGLKWVPEGSLAIFVGVRY